MTAILDALTADSCDDCHVFVHEKRADPQWEVDGHSSTLRFTVIRPLRDDLPAWLAEEDAWLADRATREAATR